MTDAFVGFAQSPKPSPTAIKLVTSESVQFEFGVAELLSRMTSQAGFEAVFGSTKKFDFRQGAKLEFTVGETVFKGTVSQINLPKRLIVNTDLHGEVELRFSTKSGPTVAEVVAKANLEPEQRQAWEQEVAALVLRFRGI